MTTLTPPLTWIDACPAHHLKTALGLATLLPDLHQVALFRTHDDHLYAVDNLDPHTGAAVICRGIVGDHAGEPTITSPMLKHVFSLRSGHDLDDHHTHLSTWPVRHHHGMIQIGTTPQGTP